jgi:hypothetical protein
MALIPKYTPVERATLMLCVRPVEQWTEQEREAWARTRGFRYYLDPKIVCLEHYRRQLDQPSTRHKPAA